MPKMMYALAAVMFLLIASPFASVVAYSVPTGNGSHGNDSGSSLALSIGSATNPGAILNAGNQHWTQSGGKFVAAYYDEAPLGSANVSYSLQGKVVGLIASGTFSIQFTDTQDGVYLSAHGPVFGYVPSICFPNYDTPNAKGQCTATEPTGVPDSSGIPAFFEVALIGSLTAGGVTTALSGAPFLVETGIMNPFGGPIVISSADNTFVIVATYSQSNVVWQGVQLEGTVSGTLGSTVVAGGFTQTVNAHENLVTGNESETGIIAMSVGSLNVQGHFSGSSTTPVTDPTNFDCSSTLGLPEDTCLATALVSTGSFAMHGQGTTVSGTYDIYWPAPSVVFGGAITATVQQAGQGN